MVRARRMRVLVRMVMMGIGRVRLWVRVLVVRRRLSGQRMVMRGARRVGMGMIVMMMLTRFAEHVGVGVFMLGMLHQFALPRQDESARPHGGKIDVMDPSHRISRGQHETESLERDRRIRRALVAFGQPQ